jgi:hypothetical protein
MEHERAVASRMQAMFKKRIPPGSRPLAPALDPDIFAQPSRQRMKVGMRPAPETPQKRGLPSPDGGIGGVNPTGPRPTAKPVNTTVKHEPGPVAVNTTAKSRTAKPKSTVNTTRKPRSADRHLEPNRDRHRPGYMKNYMRRRRAAERKGR